MNKIFVKKISLGVILSLCISMSGQAFNSPVNAKELNHTQITNAKIKYFNNISNKITQSITVTNNRVIFDKTKAIQVGLSKEQIRKLDNIYNEINIGIRNKSVSVVVRNGQYDITPNQCTSSKDNNIILKNAPSIYHFRFTATQCSDIAAILAGTGSTSATIAGVLGLTGVGIPAAIVLTIATGIQGLGSSYLWYCSNHGGLVVNYNLKNGNISYHAAYDN